MLMALWHAYGLEEDWTGAFNAAVGGEFVMVMRRRRQ